MHTRDHEHAPNGSNHEEHRRDHHKHGDDQGHDHDHDDAHHSHEHEHQIGATEYVRLGLMALVIVASLTGWWESFMDRDWLAFAATLIGGWPIYEEAWEN